MDTKFIEGFNITVEEERKELREFVKEMKMYKAIVEELEKITHGTDIYSGWLRSDIKRTKQKYFLEKVIK